MTQIKPEAMTVEQLIDRFIALATEQDQALLYSDTAKYNRLYDRIKAVEAELKSRPGDQRRALLPLYHHANWQVRLQAAYATLAISPKAGRSLLETIAASRHYPQAGYAGMSLSSLDRGIYKPK